MKSQETIIRMKPEVKARFAHFFKDPEEAEYAVRFAEERARFLGRLFEVARLYFRSGTPRRFDQWLLCKCHVRYFRLRNRGVRQCKTVTTLFVR